MREVTDEQLEAVTEYLIKEADYTPYEAFTFNTPDEVCQIINHIKAQGSISADVFVVREVGDDDEEGVEYLEVQCSAGHGGVRLLAEQQEWETYEGWGDPESFRESIRAIINGINEVEDDTLARFNAHFVRLA